MGTECYIGYVYETGTIKLVDYVGAGEYVYTTPSFRDGVPVGVYGTPVSTWSTDDVDRFNEMFRLHVDLRAFATDAWEYIDNRARDAFRAWLAWDSVNRDVSRYLVDAYAVSTDLRRWVSAMLAAIQTGNDPVVRLNERLQRHADLAVACHCAMIDPDFEW